MASKRKAEYGSDLIANLMRRYGIRYAAINPGASFRALHDSMVNYGGNENPKVVSHARSTFLKLTHDYCSLIPYREARSQLLVFSSA